MSAFTQEIKISHLGLEIFYNQLINHFDFILFHFIFRKEQGFLLVEIRIATQGVDLH
jgi:hypothetical protein